MKEVDACTILMQSHVGAALKGYRAGSNLPVFAEPLDWLAPSQLGKFAYCPERHALEATGQIRTTVEPTPQTRFGDQQHAREARRVKRHGAGTRFIVRAGLVAVLLLGAAFYLKGGLP